MFGRVVWRRILRVTIFTARLNLRRLQLALVPVELLALAVLVGGSSSDMRAKVTTRLHHRKQRVGPGVRSQMNTDRPDAPPRDGLSVVVFALLGAFLMVGAVALYVLGSFASLAAMAVGLLFIAAALIARAVHAPRRRTAAILAIAGLGLLVFGTVATPLFYLGWGLVAGGVALALLEARRPAA